jgi:hypothetical protein
MSAVMWVTQKSRLSRLIDDAGGMTVGTALAEADTLTQSMREAALQAVVEGLGDLEGLVGAGPEEGEETRWLERIYGLAYGLLELAGPFGLEDMCAAAYSLCALADGQRRQRRLNAEPIRLHVAALRLLTRDGESDETRKEVLAGLAHISERVAKAGT